MNFPFRNVGGRPVTAMARTSKLIAEEIDDRLAQIDAVLATAEQAQRELTRDEAAQCDALNNEIAALSQERDTANKRSGVAEAIASGSVRMPQSMIDAGAVAGASKWQRDSNGAKYAMLAKGEKATSLYPGADASDFGHYILARLFGENPATPPSVKAALTGDRNDLGGFLVNPELFAGILDLARAQPAIGRAGMTTVLMDSSELRIPKLASDPVFALRGENDPIAESNPTFEALNLVAKNAGCLVRLSRELVEDSPMMMAQEIGNILVRSLAAQIDAWGLNGIGGTEPEGAYLMTDSAETSVGAIDWLDISKAATHLRDLNYEPTAAIMSPKNYEALFASEVGDGATTPRGWLNSPPTLEGLQFLQTSANPNDRILIGDFSRMVMGMRQAPLVEATSVGGTAFERHQVLVKITVRFDFGLLHPAAFRKLSDITVS
jgi:HK97 family phage major capsid protein